MNTNFNEFSNMMFKSYDEEKALIALYENTDMAIGAMNDRMEADREEDYDAITITVGGIAHQFILGGPQVAAIGCFIEHICAENLYNSPTGYEEQERYHSHGYLEDVTVVTDTTTNELKVFYDEGIALDYAETLYQKTNHKITTVYHATWSIQMRG